MTNTPPPNAYNQKQQPQPVHVGIDKTKPSPCIHCGCLLLKKSTLYRIVPKLLIGAKEDALQPVNVLACERCHAIQTQFLDDIIVDQLIKEEKVAASRRDQQDIQKNADPEPMTKKLSDALMGAARPRIQI